MDHDKTDTLQGIGIPSLPGNEDQIELFEMFRDALEAGREVSFTQTSTSLKLQACAPLGYLDEDERQRQLKLIRRSLTILKEGIGYLVATKGSPIYFEFWIECPVAGGLPPHRWTSLGHLYDPAKFRHSDAEEFGLATINFR
jgi:hypothetical protein